MQIIGRISAPPQFPSSMLYNKQWTHRTDEIFRVTWSRSITLIRTAYSAQWPSSHCFWPVGRLLTTTCSPPILSMPHHGHFHVLRYEYHATSLQAIYRDFSRIDVDSHSPADTKISQESDGRFDIPHYCRWISFRLSSSIKNTILSLTLSLISCCRRDRWRFRYRYTFQAFADWHFRLLFHYLSPFLFIRHISIYFPRRNMSHVGIYFSFDVFWLLFVLCYGRRFLTMKLRQYSLSSHLFTSQSADYTEAHVGSIPRFVLISKMLHFMSITPNARLSFYFTL